MVQPGDVAQAAQDIEAQQATVPVAIVADGKGQRAGIGGAEGDQRVVGGEGRSS